MTIRSCIERFDMLYPNSLPYTEKLNMISCLEGRICSEIHALYAPYNDASFGGYGISDDGKELKTAFPYDDIYIKYLASQSDCINGDITRYMNSYELFNRAFEEYAAMYNRTHCRKAASAVNM